MKRTKNTDRGLRRACSDYLVLSRYLYSAKQLTIHELTCVRHEKSGHLTNYPGFRVALSSNDDWRRWRCTSVRPYYKTHYLVFFSVYLLLLLLLLLTISVGHRAAAVHGSAYQKFRKSYEFCRPTTATPTRTQIDIITRGGGNVHRSPP